MRRCSSVLIFAAAIVVAGCASKPEPIQVRERQTPVVCDRTPRVDQVSIQDTPPRVVYDQETEQWGFWQDSANYAALAENLQAMRQNATQLRAVIRYYVGCIADHNARISAEENDE